MDGCAKDRGCYRKIQSKADIEQEVLKPALAGYCEKTVNPHIDFRQLSNIRHGRNEEIQYYMDMFLDLAEKGYGGAGCGDPIVTSQLKNVSWRGKIMSISDGRRTYQKNLRYGYTKKNRELFSKNDKDLERTSTVKICYQH